MVLDRYAILLTFNLVIARCFHYRYFRQYSSPRIDAPRVNRLCPSKCRQHSEADGTLLLSALCALVKALSVRLLLRIAARPCASCSMSLITHRVAGTTTV